MKKVFARMAYVLCLVLILALSGCASLGVNPQGTPPPEGGGPGGASSSFQVKGRDAVKQFANAAIIRQLSSDGHGEYRLGPGDVMEIAVWNRPEISRKDVVVAPDGIISIPKVGVINVKGKTVVEVAAEITGTLSRNYEFPEIAVIVREFHNNKAFVLGRVSQPGVVNFPGNGTLLEALALAGGLPHIGKDSFLTKCAIIRGSDTVIWIDLRDLLDHGNMALNARILNNDVIFIPEAEDEMVMVLGEVEKPGPVMLKRGLSLVDAVMRAGGYTRDADLNKVYILRQNGAMGDIRQIDFKTMLETGDFKKNYILTQDDIVYVGPTGARKFNYAMEQLLPSLSVLSMSTSILDNLGLTNRVFQLQE